MARRHGMKAWLVTWDWANDAGAVADSIAAILNSRLSDDRVAWFIEQRYSLSTSTANELAAIAAKPAANLCRARIEGGQIHCGHNPLLFGRKVENLRVSEEHGTGLEMVEWSETALYRPRPNGPELVRGPYKALFRRRLHGRLSAEPVWDRRSGAFKPGWENHVGVERVRT